MEKVKLVIPDEKPKGLPQLKNLRLNLNGKKSKGRNLYQKQLNSIRRILR